MPRQCTVVTLIYCSLAGGDLGQWQYIYFHSCLIDIVPGSQTFSLVEGVMRIYLALGFTMVHLVFTLISKFQILLFSLSKSECMSLHSSCSCGRGNSDLLPSSIYLSHFISLKPVFSHMSYEQFIKIFQCIALKTVRVDSIIILWCHKNQIFSNTEVGGELHSQKYMCQGYILFPLMKVIK